MRHHLLLVAGSLHVLLFQTRGLEVASKSSRCPRMSDRHLVMRVVPAQPLSLMLNVSVDVQHCCAPFCRPLDMCVTTGDWCPLRQRTACQAHLVSDFAIKLQQYSSQLGTLRPVSSTDRRHLSVLELGTVMRIPANTLQRTPS